MLDNQAQWAYCTVMNKTTNTRSQNMMNITRARHVADRVNNNRWEGFRTEIHAAFHRLHMSAERGNKDDRALAQILWDCAGTWDSVGDLKPLA